MLAIVLPAFGAWLAMAYSRGLEKRSAITLVEQELVAVSYVAMFAIPCMICSLRCVVPLGLLAGLAFLICGGFLWDPPAQDGMPGLGVILISLGVMGSAIVLSFSILGIRYLTHRRPARSASQPAAHSKTGS